MNHITKRVHMTRERATGLQGWTGLHIPSRPCAARPIRAPDPSNLSIRRHTMKGTPHHYHTTCGIMRKFNRHVSLTHGDQENSLALFQVTLNMTFRQQSHEKFLTVHVGAPVCGFNIHHLVWMMAYRATRTVIAGGERYPLP
jgi:hypothetical protein